MGTPDFAVATLVALVDNDYDVLGGSESSGVIWWENGDDGFNRFACEGHW